MFLQIADVSYQVSAGVWMYSLEGDECPHQPCYFPSSRAGNELLRSFTLIEKTPTC